MVQLFHKRIKGTNMNLSIENNFCHTTYLLTLPNYLELIFTYKKSTYDFGLKKSDPRVVYNCNPILQAPISIMIILVTPFFCSIDSFFMSFTKSSAVALAPM